MLFLGVVLGLVIMGAMVYMALNKKSNFQTRLASLGALALMILTVIICLFIISTDKTAPLDPSTLIVGEPVIAEKEDDDLLAVIIGVIFLLAFFTVVVILAMREHKKTKKK